MHQQMPAVVGRRYLLDEQIVHAIVGMAICERQVECPLHLPAELTCLSFSLMACRKPIGRSPVEGLGEIRMLEY